MLISFNWLRELTPTSLSPQELRDRLTMVGLAIDAVEKHDTDFVLDVEVPSNRPDCLSHVGIAREVAVIERGQLHLPSGSSPKTEGRAELVTAVEIHDLVLCPRYAARLAAGVRIVSSPDWLVQRVRKLCPRPANKLPAITNLA